MKTAAEIAAVLGRVRYKDWHFDLVATPEGALYLQVKFVADGERWTSRKWLLSPHMTDSEIVQTALKAVLTAEEHETREKFTYRGLAIFGPHLDVEHLVALHAGPDSPLDARAPVAELVAA